MTEFAMNIEQVANGWDKLTAIATLLAAVGAFAAFVIAIVTYRHERSRREAEQASRVAGWLAYQVRPDEVGQKQWIAFIANRSATPVNTWRLVATITNGQVTETLELFKRNHHVLPPGESWTILDTKRLTEVFGETANSDWDVKAVLTFTDGAGVRWSRGHDGNLVKSDVLERPSRPGEVQTVSSRN